MLSRSRRLGKGCGEFLPRIYYVELREVRWTGSGTRIYYRGVQMGHVRKTNRTAPGMRLVLGVGDDDVVLRTRDAARERVFGLEILPTIEGALLPEGGTPIGAATPMEDTESSRSADSGLRSIGGRLKRR